MPLTDILHFCHFKDPKPNRQKAPPTTKNCTMQDKLLLLTTIHCSLEICVVCYLNNSIHLSIHITLYINKQYFGGEEGAGVTGLTVAMISNTCHLTHFSFTLMVKNIKTSISQGNFFLNEATKKVTKEKKSKWHIYTRT